MFEAVYNLHGDLEGETVIGTAASVAAAIETELFHLSENDNGQNLDIEKRKRALGDIFGQKINDVVYFSDLTKGDYEQLSKELQWVFDCKQGFFLL